MPQVLDLFKAADKYDVPGLVKECVQMFHTITACDDVAPLLQVSAFSQPDSPSCNHSISLLGALGADLFVPLGQKVLGCSCVRKSLCHLGSIYLRLDAPQGRNKVDGRRAQ